MTTGRVPVNGPIRSTKGVYSDTVYHYNYCRKHSISHCMTCTDTFSHYRGFLSYFEQINETPPRIRRRTGFDLVERSRTNSYGILCRIAWSSEIPFPTSCGRVVVARSTKQRGLTFDRPGRHFEILPSRHGRSPGAGRRRPACRGRRVRRGSRPFGKRQDDAAQHHRRFGHAHLRQCIRRRTRHHHGITL